MLSALQPAIDAIYDAFHGYRAVTLEDACSHCVTSADIELLQRIPLRELATEHLERYGAKAMTTWGTWRDYRHFLPRILDLASRVGASGSHGLSWMVIRLKLLMAAQPPAVPWTAVEQRCLADFVRAFVENALDDAAANCATGDLVCLVADVGVPVEPLLHVIWSPRTARAIENLTSVGTDLLSATFRNGPPPVAPQIAAWLSGPTPIAALDEARNHFSGAPERREIASDREALIAFQSTQQR